jgi:hypothetical protein
VRLRPEVFVAAAPGVREVFDVDYRTGPAALRPRASGLSPMEIASRSD